MPADELTPPGAPVPAVATLDTLATGAVTVLGRMPWSSNTTLLVEVDGIGTGGGCLRAVYKPRRGERPLWDFPAGLDRREVAAYELSTWLGWGIVPETVLREDDELPYGAGSLQRFVPFDVEAHYFTLLEDPERHDALRTICCFDLLANSADRKGGHCLAGDDDRLYAVDNGLTFHCEAKLRTVIWDFAGEPIPAHLLDGVRRLAEEALPAPVADLLDAEERAALVRRARAVAAKRRFPVDHTGRRYPWPLV
ncbi:MAG TPA: SCO1664 family protein [Acidimicrobiales bacterium]|nr:SCO1664 family protein [Acidimicrobiales bacterium]